MPNSRPKRGVRERLRRSFGIQPGEWEPALLLALQLMLAIASVICLKVAADSLFLSRFDASRLPLADLAITLFVGVAVGVYLRLSQRVGLGLLIASRTSSEELAGGILNMSTWPMMFLSGIWFSLDDTPQQMQSFANCLPLTHLVEASRDIMINGASLVDVADHIAILLGMCLVFLTLASILFRWHK